MVGAKSRIKKIQDCLRKKSIDLGLIIHYDFSRLDSNLYYLLGYEGTGIFAIPTTKEPFLIVPNMEETRARMCKIPAIAQNRPAFEILAKQLDSRNIDFSNIGIDIMKMSVGEYRKIRKTLGSFKQKDISGIFGQQRCIKSADEIENIIHACKITDEILQGCFRDFSSFTTESDVVAYLSYNTRKAGCTFAFEPIIASGKSASQPHYTPEAIRLRNGFCVIDFGVRYKGYCSDVTRTVYIGKPKLSEIKDYNAVLKAQMHAIAMIHVGASCKEIYKSVYSMLGDDFNHGLGHGIGIDVHEAPMLGPKSDDVVEDGFVFTIEPGLYRKNKYGIRIEDDIAVINKKAVVLTNTPKDLIIINRCR